MAMHTQCEIKPQCIMSEDLPQTQTTTYQNPDMDKRACFHAEGSLAMGHCADGLAFIKANL